MAGFLSKRRNSVFTAVGTLLMAGVCLGAVCLGAAEPSSNISVRTKAAPYQAVSNTPGPGKVTAVRFWSLGDVTRVAVEVSSGFHFRSDRLSNPDRLFFDVVGANPGMVRKGMYSVPVGDALVKQIRLAETQPGVTRVVLDLAQHAEFTASQLSNPDRLIIELHTKDRELRSKDQPGPPASTSVTGAKTLVDPPLHNIQNNPGASRSPAPALSRPEPPQIEARKIEARTFEARKFEARKFEPPPVGAEIVPAERKVELLPPPPLTVASRPLRAPSLPTPLRRDLAPPPPPVQMAVLTKPALTRTESVRTDLSQPVLIDSEKAPAAKADLVAPAPSLPAKESLPAKRNANGDRSMARALGLKLGRVVLDPGHGGHDVGTHGPSGLFEKDVVLDIAQRLGSLIEERMGSEVIYTRSDDTFIPLEERTQIANDRKADLFLSIHANSSPLRSAAGVETYYLNFSTSRAAMDLAARENASSTRSLYDLHELLQKIALKDKIDESREFALRLQTALYSVSAKGNVAARDRGVKKAPFVVLIGASMPSVLAEIGFLTNAGDEALLRRPEHRQKIAEALYKGIAAYADTLSHFQVAKRE